MPNTQISIADQCKNAPIVSVTARWGIKEITPHQAMVLAPEATPADVALQGKLFTFLNDKHLNWAGMIGAIVPYEIASIIATGKDHPGPTDRAKSRTHVTGYLLGEQNPVVEDLLSTKWAQQIINMQ